MIRGGSVLQIGQKSNRLQVGFKEISHARMSNLHTGTRGPSLPYRRELLRVFAERLADDKAAGLAGVDAAAARDECAEAFAAGLGWAGADEAAGGGEVDHVHVGAQDVRRR